MELLRYQTNICINIICLLLFVFLLANCAGNTKYINYENDSINVDLIQTPFIAMNIAYKDSVYKIVMEEANILEFNIPEFVDKRRRNELYPILRNDTIQINDYYFKLLQENCQFVIPQIHIDSICNENENDLLNAFFTKYGKLYFFKKSFSQMEQNYLIYVLFQHRIYLMTDCETGYIFVINR